MHVILIDVFGFVFFITPTFEPSFFLLLFLFLLFKFSCFYLCFICTGFASLHMIARKVKVDDKNNVLIAGDTEVNSGLPLKDGGGFTH